MVSGFNKQLGKGAYRNAFKQTSLGVVKELVLNTNQLIKVGVYSSITSAFLSTLATIFR